MQGHDIIFKLILIRMKKELCFKDWLKIAQDATSQVLIFLSPRDIWKFGQDIVTLKLVTWFWQRALSLFSLN